MKITSIRFNLKFFNADGGEEVVRTLDDLRTKFNLSDLYEYYKSGYLVRWLRSIDQADKADAISRLDGTSDAFRVVGGIRDVLQLKLDDGAVNDFIALLERQKPATPIENSKGYIELFNETVSVGDLQNARRLIQLLMKDYEQRFIHDVLLQPQKLSLWAWLALLGKKPWRKYLFFLGCISPTYNRVSSYCPDQDSIYFAFPDGTYASMYVKDMFGNQFLEKCHSLVTASSTNIYDLQGNEYEKIGRTVSAYLSW